MIDKKPRIRPQRPPRAHVKVYGDGAKIALSVEELEGDEISRELEEINAHRIQNGHGSMSKSALVRLLVHEAHAQIRK